MYLEIRKIKVENVDFLRAVHWGGVVVALFSHKQ
jgi:hypothetical protein